MKIYTYFNFINLFILFLQFVNSFSSTEYSTEGLYKGFRTLWKPYTQSYFSIVARRNKSDEISKNTTTSFQRTSGATIDWDYKRLFMNDEDDYENLPPKTLEIIKRKMLNKASTAVTDKEFQIVHDSSLRRWLDGIPQPVNVETQRLITEHMPTIEYLLLPLKNTTVTSTISSLKPETSFEKVALRNNDTTVSCPVATTIRTTTRSRDPRHPWMHPTIWETPEPHKTIIWAWTTTTTEAAPKNTDDYDYLLYPQYLLYEPFYGYLKHRNAKVGGTTEYFKLLPTVNPVYGTTFIWRFWSYNRHFEKIETFLALETDEQPTTTRHRTTTLANVRNASCYVCGLNSPGIPRMPGCHHAFSSSDGSVRLGMDSFKKRCLTGRRWQEPRGKNWYGELYRGGCFKRFTDVGVEFDERGCRTMEPVRGYNFASKRFARLEKTLFDVDDGCVFSPMAVLTPFSRAISLYVRYHVCVCTGKYCNKASRSHPIQTLITMQFMSLLLYILRIKIIFLKSYLFIFIFTC